MRVRPETPSYVDWTSAQCNWRLTSYASGLSIEDLRGASFLIAVSLRNPRFSKRWLRAVIDDALGLAGDVRVCLVDSPYYERVRYSSDDGALQFAKLMRLHKETSEKEQQIRNVLAPYRSAKISVFRWRDVEDVVPPTLFDELRSAFALRKGIYQLLCEQVRIGTGLESTAEIEEASVFLLREFPVLSYLYYVLLPGTIDVYPGEQGAFFWELERGNLIEEAPLLTRLARESLPLRYANVSGFADLTV